MSPYLNVEILKILGEQGGLEAHFSPADDQDVVEGRGCADWGEGMPSLAVAVETSFIVKTL